MTHCTILIIVDESEVRRKLLTSLVYEGYSVVHANCAHDALQEVEDSRPELILLSRT
jgi:CheY-like chemotaxis protein